MTVKNNDNTGQIIKQEISRLIREYRKWLKEIVRDFRGRGWGQRRE